MLNNIEGRVIEMPERWRYYYVLGGTAKIHVDMFRKDIGYEMKLDHRDGNFGFEQMVTLAEGVRYDVFVPVIVDLNPMDFDPNHFTINAQFLGKHVSSIETNRLKNGEFTHMFNFDEPIETGEYVLRVWVNMKYASLDGNSSITWQGIRLKAH